MLQDGALAVKILARSDGCGVWVDGWAVWVDGQKLKGKFQAQKIQIRNSKFQ